MTDQATVLTPATGGLGRSRRDVAFLGLRLALGLAYATYFVVSYRRDGFPFDRERVLLWVAGALLITTVGQPWRRAASVFIDWIPFALLLVAYDESYGAARRIGMPLTARRLVRVEKIFAFGHVPPVWLQEHLRTRGPVAWWELPVAIIYASHFVIPFVIAGVLWWRNRVRFKQWVAQLMTQSFVAIVIFCLMPTAPPWYAAKRGYIPSLDRPVGRGWRLIHLYAAPNLIARGRRVANPFAALPSLHSGWAFLAAFFFFRLIGPGGWRGRLRWLLFAYPLAMGFVLMYGGEHYFIDVLAGWALAIASVFASEWATRKWRVRRRRDRNPAVDGVAA